MISLPPKGQNKPSKLELVLYNLVSQKSAGSMQWISAFLASSLFSTTNLDMLIICQIRRSTVVFLSLLSTDCSWCTRHQKAIQKKVAEMLIYMGRHACVHNTCMHGYKYIFFQRLHIGATWSSTPKQFLPVAVFICR